ncbi:ATP-grasp domain-containing protein [Kitasatospora sp. MAP5-34]|uniref:ATP-grasp domain-containing protein n=1 Tax=Kitasatospora sp. MAP5-34 TaxID=3035102 RepID=UPI0024750378|nr:ATP-grasp domain-containing protein [Kitasatospora sp. MAP5-34]MDH6578576.1 biotin carboxylase [Kitasatospora sp. MAP5-34]
MSDLPHVLVIGSGDPLYREYALAGLAENHTVTMIDRAPASWQARYLLDHAVAPLDDPAAVAATARELSARHHFDGVLTWGEFAVPAAARAAAELGLPGISPETAHACRDKGVTRSVLARAGVPSARSVRAVTLEQVRAAAQEVGFPVVVKPTANAGSRGVIRADRPEDLPQAHEFAARAGGAGADGTRAVLVEELLVGPEVSVECVSYQGEIRAVALTHKTVGLEPYFEELGHLVKPQNGDLSGEPAAQVAVAALHALGVHDNVSHVELRLTADGPKIVEVNARVAGDMIGYAVLLATGIDLVQAVSAIARGQRPDVTVRHQRSAAVRFLYAPHPGRVAEQSGPDELRAEPWLDRMVWEQPVGTLVAPPPAGDVDSRLAQVVVTGTTPEEALQRLDLVCGQMQFRLEPPARATAPSGR